MGGFSVTCIKYTLFIFNLVFVVGGVALIVIGVILQTNGTSILIAANAAVSYSVVMILIGCVVFILAFFGCCGAMRDVSWKLTLYAILVIVAFLLEVALISVALGFHKKTEMFIKENLMISLNLRRKADSAIWDRIQGGYQCCGAEGPEDYIGTVPDSCCKNYVISASSKSVTCTKNDAHQTGCYEVLKDFLEKHAMIFISVVVVVLICQILACAAAFWMASAIKNPAVYSAQPPPQGAAPPATNA